MTYMSSSSSNDGSSTITITFDVGYPLSIAAVDVQNRVSQAASSLPAIVNQAGVTIKKQNPNFVLIVNLTSPDGSVDPVALQQLRLSADRRSAEAPARRRRRADLRRAALFDARLARSGQARQSRHHRRRRPERHRRAERPGRGRQDRPVAGAGRHAFEMQVNAVGRLSDPERVRRHRRARRPGQRLASCGCATSPASSSARCNIRRRPSSARTRPSCSPSSRCRAPTRSTCSSASRTRWTSCRSASRRASTTRMHYDTTRFVSASMHDVLITLGEALVLVVARRLHLPAELAHDDHPDDRHSGVADRDARRDGDARLLAQHAEPARHGAGDRPRRRRRHRRGRERRATARGRAEAAGGDARPRWPRSPARSSRPPRC